MNYPLLENTHNYNISRRTLRWIHTAYENWNQKLQKGITVTPYPKKSISKQMLIQYIFPTNFAHKLQLKLVSFNHTN